MPPFNVGLEFVKTYGHHHRARQPEAPLHASRDARGA
ncbi:MAG: hypothetical protein WAL97_07355 [Halobacteriota archaeon]